MRSGPTPAIAFSARGDPISAIMNTSAAMTTSILIIEHLWGGQPHRLVGP